MYQGEICGYYNVCNRQVTFLRFSLHRVPSHHFNDDRKSGIKKGNIEDMTSLAFLWACLICSRCSDADVLLINFNVLLISVKIIKVCTAALYLI